MSSICHRSVIRKPFIRKRRRKTPRHYVMRSPVKENTLSFVDRCRHYLSKIRSEAERNGITMNLEVTVQQLVSEFIITVSTTVTNRAKLSCPLICSFCQYLIEEPISFACGHTCCEACVIINECGSPVYCPGCSNDTQEHPQEKFYSKNHFLKSILERSTSSRALYENRSLHRQAAEEFGKKNYQKVLDIYSAILLKCDDYYAYYGRARTYIIQQEFHQALSDIERVVSLKPRWNMGYFCRSEILYAKKDYSAALVSAMEGIALDPDNNIGKQIMEKCLRDVLSYNDDSVNTTEISTIENELEHFLSANSTEEETLLAGSSEDQILCCNTAGCSSCFAAMIKKSDLTIHDFDCSICSNLLWSPITTPCGHVFCQECLIRSMDNTQLHCPMCKSSMRKFFLLLLNNYVHQTDTIVRMIQSYFPKEFNERKRLYEQESARGMSIPKHITADNELIPFEIPIFVCVLAFPHSACPLYVYESHYRLLIRRALASETRCFGMCSYNEETDSHYDYGTLLYIRDSIYIPDGRSIVDAIGRRRFRVLERSTKDGYCIARVQLIRDYPIKEGEFDELFQLNRKTYSRVRDWFDHLDADTRELVSRRFESYPQCDDLTPDSADGPAWTWIMLNLLPIADSLQYNALMERSFRNRLQIINDTINFSAKHCINQHQKETSSSNKE